MMAPIRAVIDGASVRFEVQRPSGSISVVRELPVDVLTKAGPRLGSLAGGEIRDMRLLSP